MSVGHRGVHPALNKYAEPLLHNRQGKFLLKNTEQNRSVCWSNESAILIDYSALQTA